MASLASSRKGAGGWAVTLLGVVLAALPVLDLPAGGQATPMTHEIGGKQYVVIMTGGHHFTETPIGDQVIAYALK